MKPVMKMKYCPKCKTEKSRSDFGKDRREKSGLKSQCKACRAEYRASHKVEIAECNRGYGQTHKVEIAEQRRSPIRKESHKRSDKKRREQYPEKIKASQAVYVAIRDGKLIRPDTCEDCEEKKFVEGHHESYEEENWLKVNWLCADCHRQLHRKKRLLEVNNGTDKQ